MRLRFLSLVFAGVVGAAPAFATDLPVAKADLLQNSPIVPLSQKPFWQQGWIVTLSSDLSFGPSYAQSNSSYGLVPGVDFRRIGEPESFSSPDDGAGPALYDNGWLKVGPVVEYVGGRYPRRNSRLRGLRKVDWTLEAGGFVELWPTKYLRTRLEARQGIDGHEGFEGALGLDFVQNPGLFTLAIGPRLKFGNGRFARAFYSVSPAESIANGNLAPFAAKGGITSFGAIGSAEYRFAPDWSSTFYASYDKLVGSAAKSSIVKRLSDEDQVTVGLVLSRSFVFNGF